LIAGPDEAGHAREILSLAQSLGVDSQIVLSGALDGNAKQRVLAGADAFVLPSHSEGFSMAVLEGAAAGLPVLLTRPVAIFVNSPSKVARSKSPPRKPPFARDSST
jgi:glycosyltransferase involved in cell wall biosynthesis